MEGVNESDAGDWSGFSFQRGAVLLVRLPRRQGFWGSLDAGFPGACAMRVTKEERMEFSDVDIITALEQQFGVTFAGSSVELVFLAEWT